jgi:RHS repeat-associated protein
LERRNDAAGELSALAGSELSEVHFDDAQARLYDAGNKRFLQTDPVGGNITVSLSFNAYLYCRDDPVNNIDPTGRYMPGDEALNLTPEQTAAIAVLSDNYFAAVAKSDDVARDLAHAAAEAIRDQVRKTQSTVMPALGSSKSSSGSNSAAYQQWQQMTAGLPQTPYSILVEEIAKLVPTLTLNEVMQTADKWVITSKARSNPQLSRTHYGSSLIPSLSMDSEYLTKNPIAATAMSDITKSWMYLHIYEMEAKSVNEAQLMRELQRDAVTVLNDIKRIADDHYVTEPYFPFGLMPTLSAAEKVLYSDSPASGWQMLASGKYAIDAKDNIYGKDIGYGDPNIEKVIGDWWGDSNAYQHMLWAYHSAAIAGSDYSRRWLNAHEYGISENFITSDSFMATRMDLLNNNIGIDLAITDPDYAYIMASNDVPYYYDGIFIKDVIDYGARVLPPAPPRLDTCVAKT